MISDEDEDVASDVFYDELPFLDFAAAAPSDPTGSKKNSTTSTNLVSELSTALGMIRRTLPEAMAYKPTELCDVRDDDWEDLKTLYEAQVTTTSSPFRSRTAERSPSQRLRSATGNLATSNG